MNKNALATMLSGFVLFIAATSSHVASSPSQAKRLDRAPAQPAPSGFESTRNPARDLAAVIDEYCSVSSSKPGTSSNPSLLVKRSVLLAKNAPHCKTPELVIATVPDPVHTHLALMFDRSIEAIEQGVQASGSWLFDRAYVPWDSKEHPESTDFRIRAAQHDYEASVQDWPGLMVFRNVRPESPPLFLLLVGEDPTSGIHRKQFQNAVQIQRNFSSAGRMKILGPTFSGSLASLEVLLQQENLSSASDEVRIRSGTVNSSSAMNRFEAWRKPYPHIHFASFLHNDQFALDQFLKYVIDRDYRKSDVAELSEDETDYGNFVPSCGSAHGDRCLDGKNVQDGPVQLYFPREISQLRGAFERDRPQSSEPATRGITSTLRLTLQDSWREDDSVATFSRNQTPLSQEAVLLGIITSLRKHHIVFIVLHATDPLDELFLARYLRVAYPQGRIVTSGAELLFRREVDDALLYGVLALTTYSLLPGADDRVTRPSSERVRSHIDWIFPSAYSAGVYNATLSIVEKNPSTDKLPRLTSFSEYGRSQFQCCVPGHDPNALKPSLWLTVIGHGGYWPVELLDRQPQDLRSSEAGACSVNSGCKSQNNMLTIDADQETGWYHHLSVPHLWLISCALCIGVIVLYVIALTPRNQSLAGRAEVFAKFAQVASAERAIVLTILSALLLAEATLLLLPWEGMTAQIANHKWAIFFTIAFMVLLPATFLDLKRRRSAMAWASIAANLLTVLSPLLLIPADREWLNLRLFRYIHLDSGVSPALPFLLTLGAGIWWCWYALSRLSCLDGRQPVLPSGKQLAIKPRPEGVFQPFFATTLSSEFNRGIFEALQPLYCRSIPTAIVIYFPAGLLLLSAVLIGSRTHPIRSLEGQLFDRAFGLTFLLFLCLVISDIGRFFSSWTQCKRLLLALDRLPLRRGFDHLKGFSWKPLWRYGGSSLRDSYRILSRELEVLQLLLKDARAPFPMPTLVAFQAAAKEVMDAETVLEVTVDQVLSTPGSSEKLIRPIRVLQLHMGKACGRALAALTVEWTNVKGLRPEGGVGDGSEVESPADSPVERRIHLLEHFVCLHSTHVILNALMAMRALMVGVAGVFVFLLLAVNSYPFEPMNMLRTVLVLLFLAIIGSVAIVYGQMHRDVTLSRITDSKPGELGMDFWVRLVGFSAIPLISLLASGFPEVQNALFSWVRPALDAFNH